MKTINGQQSHQTSAIGASINQISAHIGTRKMNDEMFVRLVAEDVKNRTSETQQEYLHLVENRERWKRALISLVNNLDEQIKSLKECMEVEEVKQAIQKNQNVQIIDVRNREEYNQAHIPNALNISLQELKDYITKFDGNIKYITACGKGGGRSAEGAKLLKQYGLNAMWLCGGTNKWLGLH